MGGDFFTIFARTTHTGTLTDYIYYRTLTALARAGKGQALLRSVRSFLRTLFCAVFQKNPPQNPPLPAWSGLEIRLSCARLTARLCGASSAPLCGVRTVGLRSVLGSPYTGELDFRLVYKPKRLRGCIPRPGMAFTPLFRVPLCKFHTEALRSVLGSPVQGELAKP